MKLRNGVGILSALLIGGAASAAEGVSVGGFVDAQYNWGTTKGAKDTNTFVVPDGALYLNGKSGSTEVMVDIPFAADAASSNFIDFAGKGQAFVGAKYDSGLNWKLGQFDSTFSFEKNDSVDVVFSGSGLLKGGVETTAGTFAGSPAVHRGFSLGYDFSDMLGATFLVANPYVNNTAGGDMTEGNPDFGLQVNANMDMFYVKLGALLGKDKTTDKNTWLFNAQSGFNVAAMNIGLEFKLQKDTSTGDENGFGLGGHLGYAMDDMINLATRIEWLKVDELTALAWTLGPQFKLSEGLTAKIDYTMARVKAAKGVAAVTGHGVAVGAVHRF